MYIRPLLEYGSSSFIAASKTKLERLQKVQNEAIRCCLRLPRYIRIDLLHEYAGIDRVEERLKKLNTHLLESMARVNEDVKKLVDDQHIHEHSLPKSPLDILKSST